MHFTLPEPPERAARPAADGLGALDDASPDAIAWLATAEAMTSRGPVRTPTLHLLESARARYVVGRRSFEAGPGDAVLLPPDVQLHCEWRAGRGCAVQLPAASVAAALRARRPRGRADAYLRATRLPIDAASGAALTAALHAYARAIAGDPRALPEARDAIASWLADTALAARAVVPVQPTRATRSQWLEQWIERNLAEPITLRRLCDVAGVGSRCLQKSFEARHGTSPLGFVMQRRLAAARERLLNAPRNAQVIEIALDVGVTHLGRFSQRYRAAFGEPPSVTLRSRHAHAG